jgi:hypothetical protein
VKRKVSNTFRLFTAFSKPRPNPTHPSNQPPDTKQQQKKKKPLPKPTLYPLHNPNPNPLLPPSLTPLGLLSQLPLPRKPKRPRPGRRLSLSLSLPLSLLIPTPPMTLHPPLRQSRRACLPLPRQPPLRLPRRSRNLAEVRVLQARPRGATVAGFPRRGPADDRLGRRRA